MTVKIEKLGETKLSQQAWNTLPRSGSIVRIHEETGAVYHIMRIYRATKPALLFLALVGAAIGFILGSSETDQAIIFGYAMISAICLVLVIFIAFDIVANFSRGY